MSMGSVGAPNTVLPRVLMLLPVQDAVFDLQTEQWSAHRPFGVYSFLPPGRRFPYRVPDAWVYTQLQGGLGPTDLAVEFRRRVQQSTTQVTYQSIGFSVPTRIDFDRQRSRLSVYETAFHFRRLPFSREGIYEFRVFMMLPDGTYQALNGVTAELTVLKP